MSGDNRADNNRTSEGVGIFIDRSWLDKYSDKRPAAQRSAGFFSNRFMKTSFDKESGDIIEFYDEENDPMIGIIDPLYLSYKIHEWNDLNKDPVSSPDSEAQNDTPDLTTEVEDESVDPDGKPLENAPGRVRPHSKNWAFNTIIDDKHVFESRLNRSTSVVRVSDYKTGDYDDLFQVREILFGTGDKSIEDIESYTTVLEDGGTVAEGIDTTTEVYDPTESPVHRMMHFLNDAQNKDGGYIWRGDTPNLQQTQHVDEALEVTPGYYGQMGDQWIIPDNIFYDTTINDLEKRGLLHFRHDAPVYYDNEAHGRIYFVDEDVASQSEGTGAKIKGYMAWDSGKADFDTQFNKETGEWRPVIQMPADGYYDTVFFPASGTGPYWKYDTELFTGETAVTGIHYGYDGTKRVLLPQGQSGMYFRGETTSGDVGYMQMTIDNDPIPGNEHDLIAIVGMLYDDATDTYLQFDSDWSQVQFEAPTRYRNSSASYVSDYYGIVSSPAVDLNYYAADGSFGSPSIVSSGDVLWQMTAHGYDGTAYEEAGRIKVVVDGGVGDEDIPSRMEFYTRTDGVAEMTRKMWLDESGRLLFDPEVSDILYLRGTEDDQGDRTYIGKGTYGQTYYAESHSSADLFEWYKETASASTEIMRLTDDISLELPSVDGEFVIRNADAVTYPYAYTVLSDSSVSFSYGVENNKNVTYGRALNDDLQIMARIATPFLASAGIVYQIYGTDAASSPTRESWFTIDYTGLVKLENSAIAYDDIRIYINSLRAIPSITGPTLTKYADDGAGSTGVYMPAFSKNAANHVGGDQEVPHKAVRGTSLYPHIHMYIPADAGAGASQMVVEFEHQISNVDELASANGTTLDSKTITLPLDSSYTRVHKIFSFDEITTTNQGNNIEPSANLNFRFARLGNDGDDDYDNVVYIPMVDCHYQVDTQGTRSEDATDK